MTRSIASTLYDDDFFAWTQQQAEALRRLQRDNVGDAVDVEHLAEEIEDLGKRDLREVRSLLCNLITHLVKIDSCPSSRDLPHWRAEARSFSDAACQAFAPSMRQLLDLPSIWLKGGRAAQSYLQDIGLQVDLPRECPFGLDALLTENFEIDEVLAQLAAARTPLAPR